MRNCHGVKVESKPFEIEGAYMDVFASFVSADQFDGALDLVENFGEQYIESLAKNDTKPLENVPKDVEKFVEINFNTWYEAYKSP